MKKAKINYSTANKVIRDTVKPYLEEISKKLNTVYNLKLYDVFYACEDLTNEALGHAVKEYPRFEDDIKSYIGNDPFYDFCNLEYDYFTDWMSYNHIEDPRNYIGRSSSFYIGDFHRIDGLNCLVDMIGGCYSVQIDDKGKIFPYISDIISYKDSLDADFEDLNYIISGDFLSDIKKYFFDDLKVADYINSFKENQTDAFKDYLEYQIEICISICLEDEKRQQEQKEQFCIDTAAIIFA